MNRHNCGPMIWLLALLTAPLVVAQEHDHAAHTAEAVETADAVDHAAHETTVPDVPVAGRDESAAMQQARHMNMMMHGDSVNYLVLGERFEYREDDGERSYAWEAQGWVGKDRDKLWLKTEGSYDLDTDTTAAAEVQALYSRAVAPFWDVQVGVRHDNSADFASRSHLVLGMLGLAPYWFEVDVAAFISERGDLGARLEAEYELRFTQRLLLQPRLELNYSASDDLAAGIGQGVSEASFGLRLRYELRREFAPYLGLEWERAYGATAALLARRGEAREDLKVVAGLRFWY